LPLVRERNVQSAIDESAKSAADRVRRDQKSRKRRVVRLRGEARIPHLEQAEAAGQQERRRKYRDQPQIGERPEQMALRVRIMTPVAQRR
jgi:hypothetical protein